MSAEDWTELTIRAARDDLDAVADLLADFAPGAVWIEPAIVTSDHRDFAYALVDEPGVVRAAVQGWSTEQRNALEVRLARLAPGSPPLALEERPLPAQDWSQEWKRFFHVLHAGERLVVRPSWEPYEPAPGEVVVVLDPGAAFGTGQHASTRLCLAALERELRPGARALDVGTGSGILAIAAAALGAGEVLAVDIDPEAVETARENARRNGIEGRLRLAAGSLGDAWPWSEPPHACADLVLANISSAVLTTLMPEIAAALRPGGALIAAGFIDESAGAVHEAAAAAGLEVTREDEERSEDGVDWRCLVARRPA